MQRSQITVRGKGELNLDELKEEIRRREAYNVVYHGAEGVTEMSSLDETEVQSFELDPDMWQEYETHAARWHWCHPCASEPGFCTPPWTLHYIVFAPFLWCIPMICACTSRRYQKTPVPNPGDADLVLTSTGVRLGREGVIWKDLDTRSIRVCASKEYCCCGVHMFPSGICGFCEGEKMVVFDDLTLSCNAGCLQPCCSVIFAITTSLDFIP